ncbi:transglutaminase-like cysteine peptidase [Pelagibacterium xiamenense]|uniref:transglutaminase-like cysteine peptidase n=1 Tax=Pelagibacterium xiamenense TaxID=2901140 RepID=UPI001E42702C|nr:transglutaminase-like cysteine peptidase [Pelagibacterium xiamenense]MCD7059672.1 transglutaminase-like cysteine peptidase [Pelagibacterium xiamenense]
MKRASRLLSVALATAIAFTSGYATALAPQPGRTGITASASRIETAGSAATPLGFQLFCLRTPEHCSSGGGAQVRMSAPLMNALASVNRAVNRAITPRVRPDQTWELGSRIGDCKDYVLNKRHRLIEMGVPASALRVAIGYTSWGEGHTVLVVRTTEGDFVLDNLTNEVRAWNETGHRLIAMSSSNPRRWQAIR